MGVGCQRLRLTTRPDSLAQKQALAAVGQVHLMRYYDDLFSAVDMVSGQGDGRTGPLTEGAGQPEVPASQPASQPNSCSWLNCALSPLCCMCLPLCAPQQKCAQVLLTLDNLANRGQYINAKNTFEELLRCAQAQLGQPVLGAGPGPAAGSCCRVVLPPA